MKRFIYVLIFLSIVPSFYAGAEDMKDILIQEYNRVGYKAFASDDSWFPFPEYEDREAWAKIFAKEHAEGLISSAERLLDYEWEYIPASAYMAFEKYGDRAAMEVPFKTNRMNMAVLVMAELAEGKGRFIEKIADGAYMFAGMPSWVLSAHTTTGQHNRRSLPDPRDGIIDIYSGGVGVLMSITWHFFHEQFDKIDSTLTYCIEQSVKRNILDLYMDYTKIRQHWWTGFDPTPGLIVNNWNVWCNSDVLLCFLLMEKNPDRRRFAIELSVKSVDKLLNYLKKDGACEEGPAYWYHTAGKIYDYLKIMKEASDGRFDLFATPFVRSLGEYISRATISQTQVVNFADASSLIKPEINVIYNFGEAVGSLEMTDLAVYYALHAGEITAKADGLTDWTYNGDMWRTIESIHSQKSILERCRSISDAVTAGTTTFAEVYDELRSHVPSFTWYPDTQISYQRNSEGWFVAIKAGNNAEGHHNHNDVGSFVFYIEGTPIFVEAGVGTYTNKTFSKERYSIWSMRSDWHSLPTINGTVQSAGNMFRASDVSFEEKSGTLKMDISSAYPESAKCRSWERIYRTEKDCLVITDEYSLLERMSSDVENFLICGEACLPGTICPVRGVTIKKGELVVICDGKAVIMSYPATLEPSVETKEIEDKRMTWKKLQRISFTSSSAAPLKGRYRFIIKELGI